jgi:ABC-type multidrug transport system ATPase subunit
MPGRLDAPVSEFGENLSTGQRQLICLARVLLRKCKVILMDEASSSLDHASDMALQQAIRSTFGGCTILTIAHRLNTIIASDKVLVLDGGRVAEFAHPHELLSDPTSQFSSLVDEMGVEAAAALRRAAAEAFADRERGGGVGSGLSVSATTAGRGAAVLAGTDTPAAEAGAWEGTGLLKGGSSAPRGSAKAAASGGRYGK